MSAVTTTVFLMPLSLHLEGVLPWCFAGRTVVGQANNCLWFLFCSNCSWIAALPWKGLGSLGAACLWKVQCHLVVLMCSAGAHLCLGGHHKGYNLPVESW